MTNYKLTIINSENQLFTLNVFEPITVQELIYGITDSVVADGMIIFPITPDIAIHPLYIQSYRRVRLDIICIDFHGNIKSIHKNVSENEMINLYADAVCVLELKSGLCDKFNIGVGDTVIHNKLRFFIPNKIKIYNRVFTKATLKTLRQINVNDIIALKFINLGNDNVLPNTILFLTKTGELYYVDLTGAKYKSAIEQIWNPKQYSEFCSIDSDDINPLFVRRNYCNEQINKGLTGLLIFKQ